MPEENDPEDDEFITAFSVLFSSDDNAFATLDFLEWDWHIVKQSDGNMVSYGIPDYLMN